MRALLAVVLAACSSSAAPTEPATTATTPEPPMTATAAAGPIVVELFTSQGCSSCPPADRLLRELAAAEHDRPLVALAYHVDYWNDLGWRDPFSAEAFTARQHAYARNGRVYTPALVVNGAADVVGSQRRAVARAIADAQPLTALPAAATLGASSLDVQATLPSGTRGAVAVYEDGLVTRVRAGENAGETLTNDRVVRALVPIDRAASIPLDPAWDRARLGAVVLAAGPDHRLVAAAPLALR